MPNIEMHGFFEIDANGEDTNILTQKGVYVASVLVEILQKMGLENDAVITRVRSRSSFIKEIRKVEKLGKGNLTNTPFIRICSTSCEEIWKIISALKEVKINIDVEYLVLTGFVPAEKMK